MFKLGKVNNMKRKILAFVGCLSLVATTVQPVQASYLNGYDYAKIANKKVVVTKEMKAYRFDILGFASMIFTLLLRTCLESFQEYSQEG